MASKFINTMVIAVIIDLYLGEQFVNWLASDRWPLSHLALHKANPNKIRNLPILTFTSIVAIGSFQTSSYLPSIQKVSVKTKHPTLRR